MDLERRVEVLETLVASIVETQNRKDTNISNEISASNASISNITPYTESKLAYIGDTACVFNNVKNGNTTAFMVSDNGLGIPCTIARSGDSVVVSFEKLEEVATVTISVL